MTGTSKGQDSEAERFAQTRQRLAQLTRCEPAALPLILRQLSAELRQKGLARHEIREALMAALGVLFPREETRR